MYELKLKAYDKGDIDGPNARKPSLLHVIAIGDSIEGVLCDSNERVGIGTKLECPAYRISLYDPPLIQYTNNIAKGIEVYQKDIMTFRVDFQPEIGYVEFVDDGWALVDKDGDYMIGLWDCIENCEGKVIGNTLMGDGFNGVEK